MGGGNSVLNVHCRLVLGENGPNVQGMSALGGAQLYESSTWARSRWTSHLFASRKCNGVHFHPPDVSVRASLRGWSRPIFFAWQQQNETASAQLPRQPRRPCSQRADFIGPQWDCHRVCVWRGNKPSVNVTFFSFLLLLFLALTTFKKENFYPCFGLTLTPTQTELCHQRYLHKVSRAASIHPILLLSLSQKKNQV